MGTESDDLLTARQVADLLLVHPVTLARWRLQNRGPSWVQIEGQFRYRLSDLNAYLAANTRNAGVSDA